MNRIQAFGQTYRSIKSLARDPRCVVDYYTLWRRIRFYGWDTTEATTTMENESWYVVWGEKFPTLNDLLADSRCMVGNHRTLSKRIKRGVPIQDAVLEQPVADLKFEVWNEQFSNLTDVSRDSRCVPQYKTLMYRLQAGTPLEIAVQDKQVFLDWRRGDLCER
jgi:hypothetical protein